MTSVPSILTFEYFRSLLLLLILAPFLGGCASYFKRKECEKTNWYQHGHKVAMQGLRLDADPYMKECVRVEAKVGYADADVGFKAGMDKYCKPEVVYNTGKSGQFFSTDLCDGGRLGLLKEKHKEGVIEFCQPDNAFKFAAKGGRYNKICPADLEKSFLVQFDKGRKVFLTESIKIKQEQIAQNEKKIREAKTRMTGLSKERSFVRAVMLRARKPSGDGAKETTVNPEYEQNRQREQSLNYEISGVRRTITKYQKKIETLRKEIANYRIEMGSLQ